MNTKTLAELAKSAHAQPVASRTPTDGLPKRRGPIYLRADPHT